MCAGVRQPKQQVGDALISKATCSARYSAMQTSVITQSRSVTK